MIWLILLASAVAFGLGFSLSLIRIRRRMRARMAQQMEAEVARQVHKLVLEELQQGKGRERLEQRIAAAADSQQRRPINGDTHE